MTYVVASGAALAAALAAAEISWLWLVVVLRRLMLRREMCDEAGRDSAGSKRTKALKNKARGVGPGLGPFNKHARCKVEKKTALSMPRSTHPWAWQGASGAYPSCAGTAGTARPRRRSRERPEDVVRRFKKERKSARGCLGRVARGDLP